MTFVRSNPVRHRQGRSLSRSLSAMACLILVNASSSSLVGQDAQKPDGPSRLSIDAGGDTPAARVLTTAEEPAAEAPPAAIEPEEASQPVASKGRPSHRLEKAPAASNDNSLQIDADPASLKGIQPGHSTRQQVEASWGEPVELTKVSGRVRHIYKVEPFSKVVVAFEGDTVQAIIIYLEKPIASGSLAAQLKLTGTVSVRVPDERGQPLGEAYPERGVLFAYAPNSSSSHVKQVVLEDLDPQSFLLRAETRLRDLPAHSLADAEFALGLDPQNARGHWLRAQGLAALGKPMAGSRNSSQGS